ncbi:hypothetical protein C8R46DRAFT_1141650 [Mycena filopes]|nr:hypothetical protein C8R46DRAFT_1141650 [Mycena filopes]
MRFLRFFIPSKFTAVTWTVTAGCLLLRYQYPAIDPILKTLARVVLYSLQYFISLSLLLLGVLTLLSPLLDSLDHDDPPSDAPIAATEPSQPHDEESLVPQPDTAKPQGLRGLLSSLWSITLLSALEFFIAWVLRPSGTGHLLGTYQVLSVVGRRTGIAGAIVLGPPLALFAPLILLRVICRPLVVEPHKSAWESKAALCKRIYISAFSYLLAIEAIVAYAPEALPIVAHLAWQVPLLCPLFYFMGLGIYASTILWFLTDQAGIYLVDRGLIQLSLAPLPRITTWTPLRFAQWILIPIGMVLNDHIYNAPTTTISEGCASAALTIVQLSGLVCAVFLFDLLVYWSCFYWTSRGSPHSTIDTMAASLVDLILYDAEGRYVWRNLQSVPVEVDEKLDAGAEVVAE